MANLPAGGGASESSPDAFLLPRTRLSNAIDGLIQRIGELASWLWLVLLAIIIINVALRYLLGQGYILFEELQWHLYGAAWLLALAFVFKNDAHVRIDVLAANLRARTRAWIELLGLLFLLLPFALFVVIEAVPFVMTAYQLHEISPSPGGLSHRWIIKAFIPLSFGLLVLTAFARLLRCTALLFGIPTPLRNP
jgi:TRAP-type mannitol/chloroaromatic compound transport system permease small subunit